MTVKWSPAHPMQPQVLDPEGVVRFKRNQIVRDLLDFATPRGLVKLSSRALSAADTLV